MSWQLAQFSLARPVGRPGPTLPGLSVSLRSINALISKAPGFVWCLPVEPEDPSTSPVLDSGHIVIALSVWDSLLTLADVVYGSEHLAVMERRRGCLMPSEEVPMVLWWVPEGHRPTVEEALERLALLRGRGPSAAAFSFRAVFPPPSDGGDVPGPHPFVGSGLCSR
jgi:hypothetical protein